MRNIAATLANGHTAKLVLLVAAWLLAGGRLRAAEVTHAFAYNGTNYTTKVWWGDALAVGQIQGVIVHFNYGAGANLYTNPNWRSFATTRKLAMLLHLSQDLFQSTADGLTLLQNTLNYAATQSGHTELAAAGLPYMFTGVSRGGTLGAINLGWTAGKDKTIACIAYHGASFQYVPAVGAAAKAIPVLYPIAELDPPTDGRQAIIESTIRTDSGSYRRFDGLFWTTTMQYDYAHNTTGNDTYPLQWLGRVIDIRYDPATPGILKTNLLMSGTGINYTMTDANTLTCRFTNVAIVAPFILKNVMNWVPPSNASEWLWENTTPHLTNVTCTPASTYPGATNTVTVTATDPNSEPLSYAWSLQSGPAGGTASFGSPNASNTTAVLGPVGGTYVLRVVVSDPGTSSTGTVSVAVAGPFVGWQMLYFGCTNCLQAGATANPAGDGLANLLKYALGLNPIIPGTTGITLTKSGNTVLFHYQRPANRPDITYAVEVSPDLAPGSWTTTGVTHTRLLTGDPETWQASHDITGLEKLFFRLKVSQL